MSVGDTVCDSCGRLVRRPEQYLVLDMDDIVPEDGTVEVMKKERPERYAALKAKRDPVRYCLDCSIKKGYARTKTDKSEKVITFFEK